MTESDTEAAAMVQTDGGVDQITVECPHCGHQFKTHDVGDVAGCEDCRETFSRFTNIVSDSDD